jgi:hypothetical protein
MVSNVVEILTIAVLCAVMSISFTHMHKESAPLFAARIIYFLRELTLSNKICKLLQNAHITIV